MTKTKEGHEFKVRGIPQETWHKFRRQCFDLNISANTRAVQLFVDAVQRSEDKEIKIMAGPGNPLL